MYQIRNSGWIEVISGAMLSGKTTELIRRVEKVELAGKEYRIFKPDLDNRYSQNKVVTHTGISKEAINIGEAEDAFEYITDSTKVVAFDELQFFNESVMNVIQDLKEDGLRIIVVGLDTDFRGEPFPKMSYILSIAEYVNKLHGVCKICGELGTKTQRYVDGKPAHENDPTIVVGGTDSYSVVCNKHHIVRRD